MSTNLPGNECEGKTCLVEVKDGGLALRQHMFQKGMAKLESLVALENVKKQIYNLVCRLTVERQANVLGIKKADVPSHHMVFMGNPGVGKTETARCIPEIFFGIGITKSPSFIEANRGDLVGEFIGHTEKKTRELVEKAVSSGGVLFVDEFHQLGADDSSRDFGKKSIGIFVSSLENYRDKFVCIVAGYPEEMRKTISSDPGLQSRFSTYINFPSYTTEEMLQIFEFYCNKNNHFIEELENTQIGQSKRDLIKHGITTLVNEFKEIGNGRAIRKLFEKAEQIQSIRLYKKYFLDGLNCVSNEKFLYDYAVFDVEDIRLALLELRSELLQMQEAKEGKTMGFKFDN